VLDSTDAASVGDGQLAGKRMSQQNEDWLLP
jgi:hypothetical protein